MGSSGQQLDKAQCRRRAASSCVVQTRSGGAAYKVVLMDEAGGVTEHPFATVRQCEDFIRSCAPVPAERSTLYDRLPGEA